MQRTISSTHDECKCIFKGNYTKKNEGFIVLIGLAIKTAFSIVAHLGPVN